jgi:hypothetical protein
VGVAPPWVLAHTLLRESPVTVAGPLRNRTAFRVSRNRQLAALIPRPEARVNNEGHFFEGPLPADCKAGACVRDKACEDAATYVIAVWRSMVRRERGRAKEWLANERPVPASPIALTIDPEKTNMVV